MVTCHLEEGSEVERGHPSHVTGPSTAVEMTLKWSTFEMVIDFLVTAVRHCFKNDEKYYGVYKFAWCRGDM